METLAAPNFLQAIVFAFSGKARNKTIAYSIGLFIIFSIPTALLSNPVIPYIRMIPATWLDYFFLLATSVLAAVFLVLPQNKTCNPNKTAFAGGFFGFVSFACPICNQLLVSLLGFAFLYNVINPLRPIIGIVSIFILLYAIGKKWSSDSTTETSFYIRCSLAYYANLLRKLTNHLYFFFKKFSFWGNL